MRIFVSYRRDDSSAWAGRLRDSLAARFGDGNIFQDVSTVRPGEEFPDAISAALARSDAALAVIGPHWLSAASVDGQPRLAARDDYVRFELIAALAQQKLVIPVLVGGASMPSATQLSDELKPLAHLQAVSLRDETWHSDVESLIHALRGDEPQTRPRRRVIATLVLIGLLVVGAVAALLLRGDGTNDPTSATSVQTTIAFDPLRVLPVCTTPTSSEWTDLGVTGTGDVGLADAPIGRVDVLGGKYRTKDDRWDVTLSVRFTNYTNGSQTHYWWFYDLAVDGIRFEPTCFAGIGGQNPMYPGASGDVLVGFDVTADPTHGGALNIDDVGDIGQVLLNPT